MKNGKSIFDRKCLLNKIEREDESNKFTKKVWKIFFELKKSFGQKTSGKARFIVGCSKTRHLFYSSLGS